MTDRARRCAAYLKRHLRTLSRLAVLCLVVWLLATGNNQSTHLAAVQRGSAKLARQNNDLLKQLQADDVIIKADDALIKQATSPEQQQRNAEATAKAVDQLTRCINDHLDVVAGLAKPIPPPDCPAIAAPGKTATPVRAAAATSTSAPRATVTPTTTAPRAPAPTSRPVATTTTTTTGCRIRLGGICVP